MVPKDHGQDIEAGIRRSTCSPTDVPTGSEHQNSIDTKRVKNSSNVNPDSASGPTVHAPERKLILFVVRLAVLEKAASGLGYLGFIWATVVLLGGFAITLEKTDFWFVTIILFIEGARIFIRSQELELHQYQATWLIADLEKSWQKPFESRRIKMIDNEMHTRTETSGEMTLTPTWGASDIPILQFSHWANKVFYWLQLASATACAVLSVIKLIKRNYGEVDTDTRNREAALIIFYSLALAEALFIVLEKAHWGWKVIFSKVLEEMNKECELGHSGMVPVTRFFYDAYSRCVKGSIVDGLKMDMVSFAMDLLASDSPHIQLIGIWVLREFVMNKRFSNNTLQKIRTTSLVEGRLFQMLNWKALKQKEIRHYAAEIISELAEKEALQVSEIRGAIESISSLLQDHSTLCSLADEIPEEIIDDKSYSLWTFNNLGLSILKNLARDRDNCRKIGNTRGLLPKIVDLTHAEERLLVDEKVGPFHIMTVTGSLQVLKMMASTTGTTGKQLRTEILELDSTISNIRDILNLNQKQTELQKLGIEILTSLAMDEAAAERIAGTGEVLLELVQMLNWKAREQKEIRQYAAEILLKLTDQEQNALRVAEIPDAMESISSLLEGHSTPCGLTDESYPEEIIPNESDSLWTFNNLGLRILKNLVRVTDNCRKMGITISNIGAILNLEYGEKQIELQKLGIGILTRLAMNEDAAERFGGEVLMELFKVFFKQGMPENWNNIRLAAGDALAMLALEFNNASRMLSLGVTEELEIVCEDPTLRGNAEKIWIQLEIHSIVFGVNIN